MTREADPALTVEPCWTPPHPTPHSQVLARGEKIELLVDKTEQLNQSARKFQKVRVTEVGVC